MTIKPVSDLYLITYEDGSPYKYTHEAGEAIDAIGAGFKVEEFISLENHRAAMQSFGISEKLDEVGSWNNHMNTPTAQAGNSPLIPDGYVLVPKEITCAMDDAAWEAYHETRCMSDIWAALLAAAPQQEVK
ncbi:hypothetical protein [Citrobacter werkmanii]|uniref:hypothetical protein n=1 Tax=Citrobacter werkmanii TaxID=67827 RepID=UPI0034D50968